MPPESDSKSDGTAGDRIARRVLDEVAAEPIPVKIIALAKELEAALSRKRGKKPRDIG